MAAIFKDYEDNYFDYSDAVVVKERGQQYIVYDGQGNVLGAHPIDSIEQLTTTPSASAAPNPTE